MSKIDVALCDAPVLEHAFCYRNAPRRLQAIRQPLHCRPELTIIDKARQVSVL